MLKNMQVFIAFRVFLYPGRKVIKEHTESDKNSHIFKHFNTSPLCKNKYSPWCFSILESAINETIDLKLKEAFYINKIKLELNKQLQHYNTFLTF